MLLIYDYNYVIIYNMKLQIYVGILSYMYVIYIADIVYVYT